MLCHIGTVFIDLKRAFDTVDPPILCLKLHHYVVSNKEIPLLESCLPIENSTVGWGGGVDSDLLILIETGVPHRFA